MRSRYPAVIALATAFLLFGILGLVAQAGGPRYALVIGNGKYNELGRLKNPANDAADMGQALKELGFKVQLLVDADLPSMEDAVVRLGSDLAQSADSVGFFFYAGHGVQAGGTNYLIPADARIASEAFLKNKALPAQSVLDTLQGARNALNVVVLDACRDNPFSWGRSTTRGLSVVGNQPTGSIVAYATSAGSVAQDGRGRNGVFTAELLKQIRTPGLEIKDVFNRTGKGVSTATAGKQVPAVYNQFFDSAYLAGGQNSVKASPAPAVSAPAVATTMTVTRNYGSLVVTVATAGTLYLDGRTMGDLPAGAEARLDDVDVGDRILEIRYADGDKETKSVGIQKGQSSSVSFTLSKAAAPAKAAFFAGNYEPYPEISNHGENYLLGSKIAVRSGILVKVGIISKGEGSDVRIALYDDNGDYPGKLVASASATLPPEGGRSEIPIGPIDLPAGGYWMMVWYSTATNILADANGNRDKQYYYISLADKDSLPSNYPSGAMSFKSFQDNYYLVMTER